MEAFQGALYFREGAQAPTFYGIQSSFISDHHSLVLQIRAHWPKPTLVSHFPRFMVISQPKLSSDWVKSWVHRAPGKDRLRPVPMLATELSETAPSERACYPQGVESVGWKNLCATEPLSAAGYGQDGFWASLESPMAAGLEGLACGH